jgi:diguanylate cyclase (GGDEF)-like protein/PAS domain S-box-containing protein
VAGPLVNGELASFAEAIAYADDGVAITDAEGGIVFANLAFTTLTGYSAAETAGQNLMALIAKPENLLHSIALCETKQAGSSWCGKLTLRCKDGSCRPEWMRLTPIRRAQNALEGFVATLWKPDSSPMPSLPSHDDARLSRILENAQVGVFQATLDGAPLMVNTAAARIHGYDSVDEFLSSVNSLGQDVWIDIGERDNFLELLHRLGGVTGFECRARHKDGSAIWVSLSAQLVFDEHRRPVGFEGSVIKIHDREAAEVSAVDGEARFINYFKNNGSVMLVVDPESGIIHSANPAAIRYYGYSHLQLVGAPLDKISLLPSGEAASLLTGVLHEENECLTRHHRLASGEIRDVEIFCSPLQVHGRRMAFSIIQDVTERNYAMAQLRESEERFRATFEQAAVGIVHISLDDRILHCNRRYAQIHGYTPEELVGQPVSTTLDPSNQREINELDAQLFASEIETFSLEGQSRRKDGSRCWSRITVSMQRDSLGRPIHRLAVVEDISDRKLAEKLREESEAKFRATFEQAAIGMMLLSLDGRILHCNARFAQILGYAPEELVGVRTSDIDLPEYAEQNASALEQVINGAFNTTTFERRARRKDGSIAHLRVTTSLQRDEHGRVQHNISAVEDITKNKLAEQKLAQAMEALRISEDRYRTAFETSVDAITINRISDGVFIDCNQSFLNNQRCRRDDVIGHSSIELKIWADLANRKTVIEAIYRQGMVRDYECRFRRKDGDLYWGRISLSPIEIDGVACLLMIGRDITAEKQAQEQLLRATKALRMSEARYRTAFETIADGIVINRIGDSTYIDCNQALLDALGYKREEFVGRTASEVQIWADLAERKEVLGKVAQTGMVRDYEGRFRRKNGEIFWGVMSSSVIEVDGEHCLLSIGRDISKAKMAEDEIRQLAFYDQLTQLPNRRLLLDRLRKALASSARNNHVGAVLFIDLDNFKTLNDTLGHKTGDLLLQEAASRLSICTRESDTVARLGGDEFVVVLEELSERVEEAATLGKTVAEKILGSMSRPYRLGERECLITCSIGIAIFGPKPTSADDIMQQADIAMYHSKNAGRNTVRFFAPELQAAVNARAATEDDLRQAVASGQFELYYQPQVANKKVVGAEALLRWRHPRRGLLGPGEFIALAEETGLILPLGDWILEEAFRQSAAWEEGRPELSELSLSVNISARQFRQQEFVDNVLNVLYRSGANPQKIWLELTESMLAENLDDVIAKMTQLKAHGFRFALDDFGTGYSSLAYLKRLPLDQLKIDRIFVRDILVDRGSGAIAETIVSLGKAMGLPVIAEGVETQEQRQFLEGLGCQTFQGYLFGWPLPIEDFERVV